MATAADSRPQQKLYLLENERFLAPLMMSPAILYIVALVGIPFVLAIVYAFTDITVGDPGLDFAGFETFRRVFDDPVFWRSLRNTLLFAVVANLAVVVFATALANVLVADFKGKWIIRFLVLLPWTTPVSLATITWLWTLDSLFSPLDWILRSVGLIDQNSYYLGKAGLAMSSVIAVHTWRIVPLAAVIVMAGMAAIPTEIKDAADVDGARFWRKLFQIDVPLLAPIIAVAVLFGLILTVTDISVVFVLTRGGPTHATQVLPTWAFFKGIEGGALGQGAAVALFLFPVLVAVTALVLRLARRREIL
jgi:multiple sugar transport system permease protein